MQNLLFLFTLFIIFTRSNAQEISIPYDDSIGVPIIKVDVGRKKYNFVFDTGAYKTVINSTIFPNLPIKQVINNVGGIGSERKAINATRFSFDISQKKYNNYEVLYSDLSFVSNAICDSTFVLAGIIGRDVMVDYIVEINPTTKIISLYSHSDFQFKNLNGFTKIKLRNNTSPVVPIKIVKQKRFVLYDTGSSGFLRFSEYKLKDYLSTTKHTQYQSKGASYGIHGLVNDVDVHHRVYNASIVLGKTTVTNQLFEASKNDENNMGYAFSKQFITYLDLKNKHIALKQISENTYSPSLIEDLGFTVIYNKDHNKNYVAKLSTKNNVLKLGDAIQSINGEKMPLDNCKMYTFLQKFIRKPLKLVVERDGSLISLEQNLINLNP